MDKTKITALLEALCERPLADRQPEPAEFEAFCRKAAKVLSQPAGDGAGAGPGSAADTDHLTAALAVLLSGHDSDEALRTVEEAMLRSEAARLDAQSALAFIDVIEQSPQAAPADLVDEFLAADRAVAADSVSHEYAGGSTLWSLIAGASWSARRWRMAAACTVLVAAGAASWSAYWQQTDLANGALPPPVAKTLRQQPVAPEQPALAVAPALPRPAVATAGSQLCEPRLKSRNAATAEAAAPAGAATPADASADTSAETSCVPDHQFADRPADEHEALAARQRAEAARQAAAAAQAAAEAGKVGAAQADREPDHGAFQAGRAGPLLGEFGRNPPAAASRTTPAATPAARPAAPAAPLGVR